MLRVSQVATAFEEYQVYTRGWGVLRLVGTHDEPKWGSFLIAFSEKLDDFIQIRKGLDWC